MEIITYYGTPFITNGYVLRDGGEAIVIDPGEITETMKQAIEGHKVTMVLNTHCHIDHCMANAEAVELTGAPLVLPEAELPLLHAMPDQGAMFGVPVKPSPEPDRFIEAGDTVTIGSVELAVRAAPGHSPGHIILVGDGFKVLAYTNEDLVMALRLEEAGCVSVMPLASPIGSGLGLINPFYIREIKRRLDVPVIVDAGVGTASDACVTMEQGVDGILMNTAIAAARDPVRMAEAMRLSVIAGRWAYLAGRMPTREFAVPSSPDQGMLD